MGQHGTCLLYTSELELDTLGDRKTALFLIMSDTDDTFNFVIAILQSQLFNLLCDKADDEYNGKLPVHVRFLLDEFANIGQIPRFDKLIATIRSREMSASIILQSQSQLKAIYKDAAEIILDNADSTLFSVSYTHLDVYKRQDCHYPHGKGVKGHSCQPWSLTLFRSKKHKIKRPA